MHRFLSIIEKVGNRLPDPVTLFALGTLLVLAISHFAVVQDWRIAEMRPVETADGSAEWQETGVTHRANSLLTADGILWTLKNMRKHFIEFPPLAVVLIGMLGVGIAERTGFIPSLLRLSLSRLPGKLLTPVTVFVGILSTLASDAGYVVLPPLAAVVYLSFGRNPLVGIAAAFAGVSAGFNANLFITSLDPMLSELSQTGARVIDPDYTVSPASNWYFMIASTLVLTLAGWWATEKMVEPNLNRSTAIAFPTENSSHSQPAPVTASEARGVWVGLAAAAAFFALTLAAIFIPGAPLYGTLGEALAGPGDNPSMPRWIVVVVPLLFFALFVPGLAYGIHQKVIRNDKDLAKLFTETMASMAPIIVLAFFAGQFIFCFQQSGLGRMMAEAGGQSLAQADMPKWALVLVFIGVVGVFNLLIGSMSAKYAIFAPIFVPMFMMVGISPELTQAAYRIGDSTTNIITPLNAYLIIVITFVQRYQPKAGMGTLISMMLPYTLIFTIVWSVMLVLWMWMGLPLGPQGQGPLVYP
jgi:aminobenzoyl-glutamate transport protein